MVRERLRLLRLFGYAGRPLTVALLVVQVARALLPAAQAVAVGALVARPALGNVAVVAALFLADQLAWTAFVPLRELVAKRIDGELRAGLRRIATALPTLADLESRDFQDRAARVVDAGIGIARERSAGNAATGQVELMFRMAGAVAAAGVLATFSVPLAVGLLVVSLVGRAFLRREWLAMIAVLDADTAAQRHEHYVAEQAVIGAAKDVRLFGLAGWFTGRFRVAAHRAYGPVYRRMMVALHRQWWFVLLAAVTGAAAPGVPAISVLNGDLDPARLVTCVLAGMGVLAIGAMGMEAFDIEYGLRGVTAYDELAAMPRRGDGTGSAGEPVIRFEDVVFHYPGTDRPVLDGFSLTLRPGETVAVVGENGAGKTTFVKLLAGLYRPTSGRVTVGGADSSTVDANAWLAVLFQDFVHYPATMWDNITSLTPGDDDAVREALHDAGGHELADRLDRSLWTEGTGGTDLSGGQWQRVALARALFAIGAGRRVLVLDEPTAHLDVRAEADFHERVVSRVPETTTTVLISHRLSTVRPAGRIVLIRDGRVAEDGTHEELLALGGDYHRFFTLQAEAFQR
ncbi:ABC transporter ATP-binding protein [Actinoplanes sp. NBRC 103695]|uniref:ABC transporter ATP-binding protein n=1 Tax=Actinoplanes sp. NBRC 103695 TaxID=3032202 RepID=UPI0024A37811|nr:ABC transporter ATP-binding protein [Actinoplanes sp. NBRC 103695]GLY96140.1 multidrug ABC transporter permease [Actinoplanes sp. NBRC 103695]